MYTFASFLFWILVALVFYVYFGYPLLLIVLSKIRPAPPVQKADITPTVSLIIPAYNEEKVIAQKIENSLALDYPRDKLKIIITSDASTDKTCNIVQQFAKQGVKLIAWPVRYGKTEMLNRVVPTVQGDIVVFTDANTMYEISALKKLVRGFSDADVGCVCGIVKFRNPGESSMSGGESLYYRYETFLKKKESEIHSVLFSFGGIYAIRKALFLVVEPSGSDDFSVPLSVVLQGFRSIQESEALAYERTSVTVKDEIKQKRRIIARDFKAYLRMIGLVFPFSSWTTIQLFSHKFLRWIVPFLLILIMGLNSLLLHKTLYLCLYLTQHIFYLLALVGWILYHRGNETRIFYVPFYFCVVNLAALLGIWWALTGHQTRIWDTAKTTR